MFAASVPYWEKLDGGAAMSKPAIVTCLALLLGMLALSMVDRAEGGPSQPHLNWGSQITPARCPSEDSGYRYLEINVTHHVVNDADADGSISLPEFSARYWARVDYNRHIQVWEIGVVPGVGELFCALVRYQGSWTTIEGASPQNTDTVTDGIEGTFQGGYRVAIVGELNPNPPYRTRGNIGTFDYGWDGQPTHPPTSPFDWIATYFSSVNRITYEFIGWIYHGGRNGRWVHACPSSMGAGCTGNQGDITD
jgi:hypothetical protein